MSKIIIGEADGKALRLDIDLLIPSRLLIQANSGGGKSWLLRRLAEQFYGKVQTIILDPEGEFFTLREKFGYVLVGEGGETPADLRSAQMLAEKFLELKASAVCDLYEAFRSRPMDRRQWVRAFLNALIDAPRKLWHPVMVIVDEAHKFCPQETPKAASMVDRETISGCKEAMIALSTTGRKRGFCPIWATQRLAKVDKDASAEFFNRLVGMTIEDVDVDRAADLMSVSRDEKQDFRKALRQLNPGEFFAFGRAITIDRKLVKVGPIETHHPETGVAAHKAEPPPMPADVKAFLPKLSDLPKQAEEKARTEEQYRREIRELKQQLRHASVASKAVPDPNQQKSQKEYASRIHELESALESTMKIIAKVTAFGFEQTKVNPKQLEQAIQKAVEEVGRQITLAGEIRRKEFDQLKRESEALLKRMAVVLQKKLDITVDVVRADPPFVLAPSSAVAKHGAEVANLPAREPRPRVPREVEPTGDLTRPEQRILDAIAWMNSIGVSEPEQTAVAFLAGYTWGAGAFNNPRGRLNSRGFVEYLAGNHIRLTPEGQNMAHCPEVPLNTAELHQKVLERLPGPERKILTVLLSHRDGLPNEELAAQAGYVDGAGGYNNPRGRLRSLGLIEYRGGLVVPRSLLFLEAA